jgi:hypothetical protein
MSYDLYFSVREGRPAISDEEFAAYFNGRRHYQLNDTQAWYENKDTGVYFSFDYGDEEFDDEDINEEAALDEDNPEEEEFPALASFSLNFNRPSFFVLEADIEVGQFVGNFDLVIHDPQSDRRGAYLSEEFISTWSRSNAGICSYMARQYQSKTYLYKGDELTRIWRWNYQLEDRQNEIGDNTFAPNISFLEMNGEIKSYAVWGDGMSILLPKVDILILARQELKPHRGLEKDEEPEYSVVEWADVEALLRGYSRNDLPIENFILDYELVPEEIELFFRKQAITGLDGIKTLPMDQIHDIEFYSSGDGEPVL